MLSMRRKTQAMRIFRKSAVVAMEFIQIALPRVAQLAFSMPRTSHDESIQRYNVHDFFSVILWQPAGPHHHLVIGTE